MTLAIILTIWLLVGLAIAGLFIREMYAGRVQPLPDGVRFIEGRLLILKPLRFLGILFTTIILGPPVLLLLILTGD